VSATAARQPRGDGKGFQLLSNVSLPVCRGVSPDDWAPLYEARTK
jgi:hypothetical protein